MHKEQDGLALWLKKPLSKAVIDTNKSNESRLKEFYPDLNKAIVRANKYKDLNSFFRELLANYEIQIRYGEPCFEPGGSSHYATKLSLMPIENAQALKIEEGAGFVTFIDCLTFAAQSYLFKGEGPGLLKERTMVETDIDTWLRKGHLVWLSIDQNEKEKLILEARREFDHHPVLRIKGENFSDTLLSLDSKILDEEVLRKAEGDGFMYEQDGSTPTATIEINL